MQATSTLPLFINKFLPLIVLKRFSLLLFFTLYLNFCFAQKNFSTTQLLSKRLDHPGRLLLQDNLEGLRNNKQKMPVIDEFSFRTETDELDAERQEYLLRLNFNNRAARNIQDEKNKSKTHLYELKDEVLREEQLIKRYEHIAKWYFADNELEWFAAKRAVLEDQKTIYKKMMANALQLNLDGLLKTEEDLQKMDQEMLELVHEKNFAIKQLFPGEENPEIYLLQASNWISLETMQKVLAKITSSETPTLEQELQQNDVDLAKLDYAMEVAEAEKVLDFVQAKYAGRDRLETAREFSFGLSLIIPTKSSNRIKVNEAQLDIFDEQFRLELLQKEIEEDIMVAYSKFDQLIEEYQLIKKYITNNQLEDTYKKYRSNGTVHPLTLLRIKESILKNQRELQKIEKEACLLFIDILSYKGLISRTPSINYLSNDLGFF